MSLEGTDSGFQEGEFWQMCPCYGEARLGMFLSVPRSQWQKTAAFSNRKVQIASFAATKIAELKSQRFRVLKITAFRDAKVWVRPDVPSP